MERLKQMSLKKALFTIAFINMTIALILSLLSVYGCMELSAAIAPQGTLIKVQSGTFAITNTEMPEPPAQAAFISEIISAVQILLPILIYIAALFATAALFYRLKIKEPLTALTDGASHIINNDLDFTIETRTQDELGQLCIAFETMRKTLLANNRELWRQTEERKRLNAAFSHNLRNPVTVLKGSAKLAKNSVAGGAANIEQLTDNLSRIESYTDRIERYIETMSSIQKLEEIEVKREAARWENFISELENVINLVGLDSEKHIEFVAGTYTKPVLIDKFVLFQIAENLISNAIRFAMHNIFVSCSITGRQLILSVSDDGCGFPAALLTNGIGPFQKGTEDAEHFGMGLYTCELLCGKHGGGIAFKNNQIGAAVTASLEIA